VIHGGISLVGGTDCGPSGKILESTIQILIAIKALEEVGVKYLTCVATKGMSFGIVPAASITPEVENSQVSAKKLLL